VYINLVLKRTLLHTFIIMADKSKPSKKGTKVTGALKQDKEVTVEVKQLLKDDRTHKIVGAFFVLLAILFFVAFTSYLFTWEEDQDKVFKEGYKLLFGTDSKLHNLMGSLGAFLSHLFIFKGFGVASYLVCTFFFILGINLFFGQKVFSLLRNFRYLVIGLPLLSLAASIIMQGNSFAWGGAVGDMLRDFLYGIIGKVGSIALLLLSLLAYIIWRYNPDFNGMAAKAKDLKTNLLTKNNDANIEEDGNNYDIDDSELAPSLTIKKQKAEKLQEVNLMQNDGGLGLEIRGENVEEPIEFDTKIKEEDSFVAVMKPLKPVAPAVTPPASDLELEVKVVEEEIEETPKKTTDALGIGNYDPILDLRDYKYPSVELLENHGSEKIVQDPQELENNKNQIISTLKNYDIEIQKIYATVGPTVTLYEIIPAPGVRISRIKNLEDDIALSLAALGIRIIAPIPGKGTIGIEVPNTRKTMVSMRTLLDDVKFSESKFSLPIAIGKRIDNTHFVVDLASMPHLLMAGATGQGKSVGLNAILVSLLYKKHPSQLKFVLVDPKKVELSIYKTIEKHFLAKLPGEDESIITDTKKVVHTLNALCIEMDNRYDLLKEAGCRNIKEYNEKFIARRLNPENGHQFLPFIVLVVDEFADLIMTAGKEVEMPIARLAQLARAIGIHLIIATQRPSVNIITGTIKANFPARIAFKVSSKIDSRTILDIGGAEQLIGKGDMLISYNGELVRLQCAFVDTPEVDKIVDFIGDQRGYPDAFMLPEYVDEKEMSSKDFDVNDKDALFEDAARLIVMSQSGSTSLLQRKMKLGYNRAGRLMDQLEAAGIVGPNQGSKVRDVLVKTEADLQMYLNEMGG
jgi:DNA segregation ATPase FtsK/SpoIIIE, S-DNA-T family